MTTRSSVYQSTGSRTVENNEIVNNYTVEFGIRFYHNVNEFDRIRWNDKLYRIESIVPDRQKNHKTIIASLINE
ncbi:phage head closure protein [Proteiniphilum acetatigenes]|uniref:phage head closure protein n=1 Tax=Proteiniphilum acetatigenes TaxID=294710 RepID=UPI0009D9788C